jgi:hypothetical protein
MKVLTTPEVKEYLNSLIFVLHEKEYFGFRESAREYVIELLEDMTKNLPIRQHKLAPERYARYGEDLHYASFARNKRTTWYAFFTKYQDESGDTIYLIRYIGNNHTVAQHL